MTRAWTIDAIFQKTYSPECLKDTMANNIKWPYRREALPYSLYSIIERGGA